MSSQVLLADMVWPALYFSSGYVTWWVVVAGPTDRSVPVVESAQSAPAASYLQDRPSPPRSRGGLLRRRDRHPPESAHRPGLDAAWPAEARGDAGTEPQALPRRSTRGRWPRSAGRAVGAQEQRPLPGAAREAPTSPSRRAAHPSGLGQLRDPLQPARAGVPATTRRPVAVALPASL